MRSFRVTFVCSVTLEQSLDGGLFVEEYNISVFLYKP